VKTTSDLAREVAASLTRRLLEIGLPEKSALHARDAAIAHIENYYDRRIAGECEPR
jgi:hypothetical protein